MLNLNSIIDHILYDDKGFKSEVVLDSKRSDKYIYFIFIYIFVSKNILFSKK